MLYFLLFIEGFIGLTFQLLFFRQLTPAVGSSSTVDAWTIGFFLGALGVGYAVGGKPASQPLVKLGRNLILSAIVGAIGASSLFVDLYFNNMAPVTGRLPALIVYATFIIAPVAYLMGQSLPLLIQCSQWGSSASEKGGNALSLSTVGSMAGAILPITVLTPLVGATVTLAFNTALATLVGLWLIRKHKGWGVSALFGALIANAILLGPYFLMPSGKFTSSPYADLYLLHSPDGDRQLFANGLVMSAIDSNGISTSAYIHHFQDSLVKQRVQQKEVLILGAGGFTAHTRNPNNNNFTYVDVDEDLVNWAETHFNFKSEQARVVVDDARSFLLGQPDHTWPVIFVDTYASRFAMPEHLMTQEFFLLLSKKVAKGGVVMFNAIIHPQYATPYSRRLHSTVTSVFPYCQVNQVTETHDSANMHYTCFAGNLKEAAYTDDKHTIASDVWSARQ